MIEKEDGFIYLEKNEIAFYISTLWESELTIQSNKSDKYPQNVIITFQRELWRLILKEWDGKSLFRLSMKAKTPDPILSRACQRSGINYYDLPNEFSVFRPNRGGIEWRGQSHPCRFHKSDRENFKCFENIGEP